MSRRKDRLTKRNKQYVLEEFLHRKKGFIVKVQLDVPNKETALVYNESRSVMEIIDAKYVKDSFDSDGDEFRRYFRASLDGSQLILGEEVEDNF